MTPRQDVLPRVSSYRPRILSELLSYDRVNCPGHKTGQYGRCKVSYFIQTPILQALLVNYVHWLKRTFFPVVKSMQRRYLFKTQ